MNAAVRRRSDRGHRPEPAGQMDAFHLISTNRRPTFAMLADSDIAGIRARGLDVLESHGVVIRHPQGRAAMLRAGCCEGADEDRVRTPSGLVEEALAATPKTVTLCGKRPERDIAVPRSDRGFVMRTGIGAHGFVDPSDSRYRHLQLSDAPTMAALANHLDRVGFVAHPFVHGVPELTSDFHGYAPMLAHTDRHCWIQPYNTENVEFLMQLGAIAAGGEQALRARPIASCIVCSFTPLEFKVMDSEAMIQSGRYGLPIHACSLPSAGGTAPGTSASMVTIAAAEIVAMVTKAHVLAPGTAVIATPLMFTLDMRTGRALQSCVESLQSVAMAVEFMKRGLGLVAHSYGARSDRPDVDAQSMAERALICQTVALAGADSLGGVGQLECATVFSPVQAVLDNELGGTIHRFVAAPEVSDEAMNWDELSIEPAGVHFLGSPHTLKNCRTHSRPRCSSAITAMATRPAGGARLSTRSASFVCNRSAARRHRACRASMWRRRWPKWSPPPIATFCTPRQRSDARRRAYDARRSDRGDRACSASPTLDSRSARRDHLHANESDLTAVLYCPATLEEALQCLSGGARVLAGGTDVMTMAGEAALAGDFVDVSRLAALQGVVVDGGEIRIGGATTWTEIVRANLPPALDALKAAAREVGAMQIQNRGTVAGNLCNASPAADGVPPLLTLDAEVELVSSRRGIRRLPLSRFLTGPRRTEIAADEILAAVICPAPLPDLRSTFLKLGARRYLVISIVMVAVALVVEKGVVREARVAIGACSPVAMRLVAAEQRLRGADAGSCLRLQEFADLAPIDDLRGDADYRRAAALTLTRRAVDLCLQGECGGAC